MNSPDSHSPSPRHTAELGRHAPQDPTFYLPKVEASRFVGVLLRRGWIIPLAAVLAAALAWWVLDRIPKTYVAEGSVYVSTQAPQILEIQAVASEESQDLEQLHSVEQGMQASTLLLRVIEKNGLVDDRSFIEKKVSVQSVLAELEGRVRVELRRGTRIIDIAVEDTDPVRAQTLVESIKSEYELWSEEGQQALLTELSAGMAKEETRLHEQMDASEMALQEFRIENPVPGLEGVSGSGSARDRLGILSSQLTQAKTKRLELEAQRQSFRKFDPGDPDALAGLSQNEHTLEVLSVVRTLREKELEFVRVKERYLHKHPVYKEVVHEIAVLKENLQTVMTTAGQALEKSYQVALENETKLESEVAMASRSAVGVESLRARFAVLKREALADRELYAAVAMRLRKTSLAASVPASVISWREQPLAPEKPAGPRKMLMMPLAAMAGVFLGLMAVVGLELGDRRVRDTAAVTRATGVPLLAKLPAADPQNGMVMLSDPNSETAEAFRRLRAVLMPPVPDGNLRTLLFTSARAGEGKSFCAMNHAVSLAMQGHRTLLVDADLRSPGLSREHLREAGSKHGLGDFLGGKSEASDACFATPVPKLYLISSGEIKQDAAELLSGSRFPGLLEDAYRWFDRVVIDVPAVLSASDAQVVARFADRTCLVVGEGGSDRRDLHQAAEHLRAGGANLVGFVWNQARPRHTDGLGPSCSMVRHTLANGGDSQSTVDPGSHEIPLSIEELS